MSIDEVHGEMEHLVQSIVNEVVRAEVIPIRQHRCRACHRLSHRPCEPCKAFNGIDDTEWDRALREVDDA
jgi:hypothetical protein